MEKKRNAGQTARRTASMGLLLALALVLNLVEGMLPALPAMPPGVRLGLSNIVVLYCVLYLGRKEAFTIAVLKSGFVLLTRGFSAGFISLCGGLLSVAVMALTARSEKLSVLMKSVMGALAHNLGQLVAASVYLQSLYAFYYAPVLVLSGILMGSVTALLTKTVMPALRRISGR